MARTAIVEVKMDVRETLAAILQPANSIQVLSATQATRDVAASNVNSHLPEPSAGRRLDSVTRKKPALALLPPVRQIRQNQTAKAAVTVSSAQADNAHLETSSARQSWAVTPRAMTLIHAILSLAPSRAQALILVPTCATLFSRISWMELSVEEEAVAATAFVEAALLAVKLRAGLTTTGL